MNNLNVEIRKCSAPPSLNRLGCRLAASTDKGFARPVASSLHNGRISHPLSQSLIHGVYFSKLLPPIPLIQGQIFFGGGAGNFLVQNENRVLTFGPFTWDTHMKAVHRWGCWILVLCRGEFQLEGTAGAGGQTYKATHVYQSARTSGRAYFSGNR